MPPVVGTNYVLNIYIHKIMVQKQICCIDENHETCVSCKFLEKITFDLSQPNDPRQQNSSCACVIKFEKGKTCLFLMSADMSMDMNLYMDVWQKMSCACLPSKLPLGNTKIDLSDQFEQVNAGVSVKPIKGYYTINNNEGEEIAVVDMMVRLSKLNEVNLNDFTMNDAGNNFMIKGNDDPQSYMFKRAGVLGGGASNNCDPAKMVRDLGAECCSDKGHSAMGCGGLKGGAGGFGNEGCGRGGGGGGGGGCCGADAGGTTCSLPRAPSDGCGCFGQNKEMLAGGGAGTGGDYEEIGATLNGNQIKIRVPRSKGSKGSVANLLPPTGQNGKGERTMVFGQNEILLSMRQGGPGEATGAPQDAFTTKFTACGDPNEGKPTMAITPSNVPQGVEAMKVIHPDKDVFLLRINKKCRMADKANLELELVTPKPPEKPPKPQSESRNTQYDEADIPQPPPPEPEPEPFPEPPPEEDKKKGKGKAKGKDKKDKGDKKDKKEKGGKTGKK